MKKAPRTAGDIKFGGAKFSIRKTEHVGNKGDFPELGDELKAKHKKEKEAAKNTAPA